MRTFSAAVGGLMMGTMLLGAIMFYVSQYLQLVAGLSPLQAGLWMLPSVFASIVGIMLSPLIARVVRPAYLIGAGLIVSVIGLLLLTQVEVVSGLITLVVAYAVISLGASPLVTLGTDLVVGSVPPEKSGAAAAVSESSSEFGFAFGLAILGSIGNAIYRDRMADSIPSEVPETLSAAVQDNLAEATIAIQNLPESIGLSLLNAAREAYNNGMHAVAVISAILLIGVAFLAVKMLRQVRPSGEATAKVAE